jgi:hypothetical protein
VAQIKQWLLYKNLTHDKLINQLKLSKTCISLRYSLDSTVCQNDKLIYIAHPTCIGFDDPMQERICIAEKGNATALFDFLSPSSGELRHLVTENVNTLRKAMGLKSKEIKYKVDKAGQQYLDSKSIDVTCQVTGIKANPAGFTQLNLDGGDSWGYYYQTNKPYYLYNYKGEPIVKIEDLLPEYYRDVLMKEAMAIRAVQPRPFVFRDHITDSYTIGKLAQDGSVMEHDSVSSRGDIADYFVEFGTSPPDPIPTWHRTFDPSSMEQYDPAKKVFNEWTPTKYMKDATPRALCPKPISDLITYVVAGDAECYHHFMNWLAYIYQYRTKSGTAWVLHGTQGTGKGVLFNNIIKPIFGAEYCASKLVGDIAEKFNNYMEHSLFVNIDEARIGDAGADQRRLTSALKAWITDPMLSIRGMHQNQRESRSYVNFILSSNEHDALDIHEKDRRYNVAPRQEIPIKLSIEDIEGFEGELMHFAGFMAGYKVDVKQAHTALNNEAKRNLRAASMTSIDEFGHAVKTGDLQYFVDGLDDESGQDFQAIADFKKLVPVWMEDYRNSQLSSVRNKDLFAAYRAMHPARNMQLKKFLVMMGKINCPAGSPRVDGVQFRGWRIGWQANASDAALWSVPGHLKVVSDKEIKSDIVGDKEDEQPK